VKPTPRREAIAEIVQTLQSIIQSVHTYSKRSLRRYGLTGPQIWALRCLQDERNLTMSGLAGAMYLHVSTVSGLVDRLEARGYLDRVRDRLDRRFVRLALTSRGRAVIRRTPEPPRSRLPRGLQRLSDADIRCLRDSMRRLARIMEAGTGTGFEDWSWEPPTRRRPA
jgi:DNA-binding MarR family transcriptional regulator